ncbi:MAG: ATP-dependent Zn protease [Lentilitoribacter sp.]
MTNIEKPLNGHGNKTTSPDHQTHKMPAIDQLPAQQTTLKQEAHQRLVLKPLAMSALGRTEADIERLVREERQKARREKRKLIYDDIKDALSIGQSSMPKELLWRIAIHESGHALAMIGFDLGTIQTISVGTGAGGFVESDIKRHAIQGEDWINRMLVFTLAGRTAEVLILGDAGMGSGGTEHPDLAQATNLALDAETNLGFGKRHPLLYRRFQDQSAMLTGDRQLAQRVHCRLEVAEAMAKKLLNQNRDVLPELAKRLATEKVLDGDEVHNLVCKKMNTGIP